MPRHVITDFAVIAISVVQVVQHLLRLLILTAHCLCVRETLSHYQTLALIKLNSLGELAFFFVQVGVLILLLANLGGGFEKSLEISLVALVF